MVRCLGRLPLLGRRSRRAETSDDRSVAVRRPLDPELAPLGPPALLPRMIFRQMLFDATELVPAWAMARPEPALATPAEPPKAKRPRRTKTGASTAKPKSTMPRRPRKATGTTTRGT